MVARLIPGRTEFGYGTARCRSLVGTRAAGPRCGSVYDAALVHRVSCTIVLLLAVGAVVAATYLGGVGWAIGVAGSLLVVVVLVWLLLPTDM